MLYRIEKLSTFTLEFLIMNGNILITGAGGFIGGFIVDEAIKRGYTTWAGVRNTTSREYLTYSRIVFVDLDYAHPDNLRKQLTQLKQEMGGWDYIIHNMGITKCKKKRDFYRINHYYLRNLVDALIACDMVPRKFIYMSSLSAIGKGDELNHTPFKLTDIPNPDTNYGKSKLMSEQYLASLPNFPYIILRPTGVYGPREKDYLMIMKCIKWYIDFRTGFSKQLITFIYVKDLVRAIFCAIDAPVIRRTYFLSEEQAYTSSGFGEYVARELKRPFIIPIVVPCWMVWIISIISEWLGDLLGHTFTINLDKYSILCQRNWVCDTTPTREELGFTPQYTLEEGVKETVAWYKEHKWL